MTVGTETAVRGGLIRVLIADDQDLFRSALGQLLTEAPDLEVVGEAGDGAEAVRLVGHRKPDIVLMDVRMPTLSGIEATRRLNRDHPEVKVLILTSFDADAYVVDALRAGADGYVLKDSSPDAIAASIRAVISSEKVMSRQVADRVLAMLTGETAGTECYDGLTARELEVLKLIAHGRANKRIAFELRISEKTVRNHISHIYEKLEIYDRAQAVLYAVRKGLVTV
jgi:DNA-binding NarL/FixJ family response regulator